MRQFFILFIILAIISPQITCGQIKITNPIQDLKENGTSVSDPGRLQLKEAVKQPKVPESTTKSSTYVFTLTGAIESVVNFVPEGIRPNATEVAQSAGSFFGRLQSLGKVVFCNPFFAGLNPGSCVLLHNATVQGLQG